MWSPRKISLDVGGRDDERALLHDGEQQRGGGDLRDRGHHRPGNRHDIELGNRQARRRQHDGEEQQGEGQAKEKADVGCTDRAQRGGQLLLHGIAQHLAAGSQHREDGPQPRHATRSPERSPHPGVGT